MSNKNKYFANPESSYTELFQLLPRLTQGERPGSQLNYGYTCDTDLLEAAAKHARNSIDALTTCMQSLGSVISYAAESGQLSPKDMGNMGWLMRELTNMMEACDFLRQNAEFDLADRGGAQNA